VCDGGCFNLATPFKVKAADMRGAKGLRQWQEARAGGVEAS
jgi:hypothetical protein